MMEHLSFPPAVLGDAKRFVVGNDDTPAGNVRNYRQLTSSATQRALREATA